MSRWAKIYLSSFRVTSWLVSHSLPFFRALDGRWLNGCWSTDWIKVVLSPWVIYRTFYGYRAVNFILLLLWNIRKTRNTQQVKTYDNCQLEVIQEQSATELTAAVGSQEHLQTMNWVLGTGWEKGEKQRISFEATRATVTWRRIRVKLVSLH